MIFLIKIYENSETINLTELNQVQPDQLIIGQEHMITNLGGDGDYTENLSPRKMYRGTVRECCPHNSGR